ncbi:MAG TPA: NADH-quinone oxidoreductase subunit L [Armatimonadota bacterium]|jgi:NADH-quinone oxidoreductase subunit L
MIHLTWLIPILPFTAAAVLLLGGAALQRRIGERVGWIGVAGLAATLPLSLGILVELLLGGRAGSGSMTWAPLGDQAFTIGYATDALTAVMLAMVSVVATCIQVYSLGYMHGDPRFSRFFGYVSLFCGSMFLIVITDSLLVLYVGWELVGLCSYLLIGFWFERPAAARAAMKAFITTRIGDLGFALGIFLLFMHVPSLRYTDVFAAAYHGLLTPHLLGIIALLLFCGAIGKSAQFPLHTWLPDAMEGPTPVSALIHAATMVAAGVFMVARLFPLFYMAGSTPVLFGLPAFAVVCIIGLITAIMAALIGVVQNDIKRVLAYSTISQLGYMMAALGLGVVGFVAGVFHLIVHAFFKALLFMGSGSVIHGMSGEQDMGKMGGLGRRMPITAATFWIGSLALAGVPVFAGFFSKDEILSATWKLSLDSPWYWGVFAGLELSAFLTAFYIGRACFLTFSGAPRTHQAEHAHESPATMTAPLVVLAVFALLLGWVGTPLLAGNLFEQFVHYAPPGASLAEHLPAFNWGAAGVSVLMALSGLLLAGGIYRWRVIPVNLIKYPLYPLYWAAQHKFFFDEIYAHTAVAGTLLASRLARLVDVYVIDMAVNLVGWGTAYVIAFGSRLADTYLVDGAVNLVGWGTRQAGAVLARLQTGRVQEYVTGAAFLAAAIALALLVASMFVR